MGKIFGAIFSVFGSFFGVIGKLFGFKKSGYYLELGEEGSEQSAPQAVVATPLVEANSKSAPAQKTKTQKTKAKATPAEASVAEAAVSSSSPDGSEVAETKPAEPVPQASVTDPVELIRAALSNSATSSGGSNGAVTAGNFATDYLVLPSRSGRRRPGPSLSPFKDMAKGMRR